MQGEQRRSAAKDIRNDRTKISQLNYLQEPTLGDMVLVQVLLLVVGAILRLLVKEVVQLHLLVPFFIAFGTKARNTKEPH